MKCTKCGTEIPDSSNFCPNCGQKMGERNYSKKENYVKDVQKFRKEWLKCIFLLLGALLITGSVALLVGKNEKSTDETPTEMPSVTAEVEVEEPKITIPLSSEEFASMDYTTAKKKLEESGFTNVSLNRTEELKYDEADKIDTVKEVSIDGTTSFLVGDSVDENAYVTITYYAYAKCKINVHVEFLSNLLLNKHDVRYSFGDFAEGVLSHGENLDLEVNVEPGEYSLLFTDVEDAAVKGEIVVGVKGDMNASYGIRCANDEIMTSTVYVEEYGILKDNEIMLPNTAIYYSDMASYKECEAALKELGFTNIKTEPIYDIVLGITSEGETKSVTINGNADFNIGDVFEKDAEVVIEYHMKSSDDPNKPEDKPLSEIATDAQSEGSDAVWFSTNTVEDAKNGNSGVFAYKRDLSNYDIYYIIDFDEGYVYNFAEGNGNDVCDRLKIESGTLNDAVLITYHVEGEDDFSYGLHFKYKNAPATLIVQDNDGFDYEFRTTDLDDALKLLNSKEVSDY